MEREELKSVQAPLKERYEAEPESALVTLEAEGTLGEGVYCTRPRVATARCSAQGKCCWRRWRRAPG
jgi:hypothetical protein